MGVFFRRHDVYRKDENRNTGKGISISAVDIRNVWDQRSHLRCRDNYAWRPIFLFAGATAART